MGWSCSYLRSKEYDNKCRNTFRDYANYHDYVFVPYLNKQLDYVKSIGIIWDTCRPTYMSDSLKAHAREDRDFISNQRPKCSLISLTGYIWFRYAFTKRWIIEWYFIASTPINLEGKKDTCHWHICSGARIVIDDCEICLGFGHGLHLGYFEMDVHYRVFNTEVSYACTHGLDVIWHLRSVQFARKQHESCGSHSLKHCKLGISKISTTAVTDADMKVLERYVVLIYSCTLQLTEAIQQLTVFQWQQEIRKYTPITCSLMSTWKPISLPSRPHMGTGFVNNHFLQCPSEWG